MMPGKTRTGKTREVDPANRLVRRKRTADRERPGRAVPVTEPHPLALRQAMSNPAAAQPGDLLTLQRQVGNQAVSRLIQAKAAVATKLTVGAAGDRYEQEADRVAEQVMGKQQPASSKQQGVQRQQEGAQTMPLEATITRLVQRQAEEEEEIQTKRLQRQEDEEEIQTKPLVQRQEEEEEEIQTKRLQRQEDEEEEIQTKRLQRKADGSFDAGPGFEDRLAARKGGGRPLPQGTRAFMEPRFGADFSEVRVHAGADAARLNRQISARAFTHGKDIYVGEGRYNPGTDAGDRLLAHELTHTIQQTGGRPLVGHGAPSVQVSAQRTPGIQRKFDVVAFYGSFSSLSEEEQTKAVLKLLKKWSGIGTRKSTRRKNVALLMKGAAERNLWHVIGTVEDNHASYFKNELAPDYENVPSTIPEVPEKMESGQKLEQLKEQLEDFQKKKAQWEGRLKDQSWQDYLFHDYESEATEVALAVGGIKEKGTVSGQLGFSGTLEKELTSSQLGLGLGVKTGAFGGMKGKGKGEITKGKTSVTVSGEGDFLAGVEQNGEVTLTLDNKYAQVISQLEEQVKLGTWGEGSGKFSLGLSGISAEAKAYLAIGGQAMLKGKFDAQTKKGGIGLLIEGQGTAFAGAEAGGEAEFSASLTKGIAAAVKAKAFAGVKAEATGKCMFKLLGRPIFGVEGTAGVSYGAGGELEATMKIPVFGNSEFGFKATAALGLGTSSGAKVLVNAGNVALSAKEIWLKLKNMPTTMQGYESTLTMQDQEVLQKLNKLIAVYDGAIKQTRSQIRAIEKKPVEKQSLLL
jgi:hypothetical protein